MSGKTFAADFAAAKAKGPTGTQQSSIVPELANQFGFMGGSYIMPPEQELSELWTGSKRIETVKSMLNHFQIAACRAAIALPAHRYVIELAPQDCERVAAGLIANDLDVPLLGQDEERTGRRARRFSERKHRDRAFGALDYGYAIFEHAGYYAPGIINVGEKDWRLRALPPVPQRTIEDQSWEITKQGELLRVVQYGSSPPVKLDVDKLCVFTWGGEPGDFRGRSIWRSCTGAWLSHDRTMRVMQMSDERTGMGIPVGAVSTHAAAGAKAAMERLLAGMAAGHDTNLVLETDEDIRRQIMLMGVTGSTPNIVEHLRYYDEAIARATLTQVVQVGQGAGNTGSYALSQTFDQLLMDFHDAVIGWYCDVMQEQLVEPWVDRNLGEDYNRVPRLVWSRREEEDAQEDPAESDTGSDTAAPASVSLSRRGRERGTAVAARRQHRLRLASVPEATRAAGEGIASEPGHASSPASLSRRGKATRAAFAATTGRDLRRDPTPVELAAATDFAQLEQQFVTAHRDLSDVLVRDRSIISAKAVNLVEDMATVDPLTLGAVLGPQLAAFAEQMDTGPIVTMLTATASQGVAQVVGEAARQGVTVSASIDYAARAELEAREMLRKQAAQITETVAGAAKVGLPATVEPPSGLFSRLRPARFGVISEALGAFITFLGTQLGLLTSAAPEQAAAGATARATGAGRYEAMAEAPVSAVYVSALLDSNVCGPCAEDDGQTFATVAEARQAFPNGPNPACEGWERCRCLLVAIMADEQPAFA